LLRNKRCPAFLRELFWIGLQLAPIIQEKGLSGLKELKSHYVINRVYGPWIIKKQAAGMLEIDFPGKRIAFSLKNV
jgi:hypothetical protein